MNDQHDILHTHKAHCHERLRGLKSYVDALTEMTAKHGTDEEAFKDDLEKAKCDLEYYEARAEMIGEALGSGGGAGRAAFHVYEDKAGEWRWNLKASNGRIVADSGEGYRDRDDCLHGIEIVKNSKDAPVKDGH